MSSSNSSIEKVENPTKAIFKYECLDCENYKRKVKEAEQTVSGRDVLIEMLQAEIKKMEERYKTSIDDYELLRFKYCTVVQELSNLKEIHKKLEKSNLRLTKEREITKNQLEILQNEVMETCKNQCKELTIELVPTEGLEMKPSMRANNSLHENILKEVMNIEVIMQNQNETVKDVLLKVLNEMKGTKGIKQIEEALQKATIYTSRENIKDRDKEDLLAIIEDLTNQIDGQVILLEKLKAENESIKTQLAKKKSNLAQCLDVLEDNHSNLNNLSGNIEMIINEKETYLKEIEHLKNLVDENEKTIKEKDEEITELKTKLDSTQPAPETEVNRENEYLRRSLNAYERELELLQEEYLEKTTRCSTEQCKHLAHAIEETKNKNGDLQTSPNLKRDTREISNQTENDTRDNEDHNKIMSSKYETEIHQLNENIKTLEQNLEQAKLENNEYEEENKYYSQKVESLVMHLQVLEKEKLKNDSENVEIAELREEYEALSSEKEREIKALKDEINILKKNNHEELKIEIVQMEENIKTMKEEKAKVIEEKEHLKNQLVNLQNEIICIQEKDEKQLLALQEKIDRLENSQNEKQEEIDECCCVVRNIKKTIANKNFIDENNLSQIAVLEEKNKKLQELTVALKSELATLQEKYKGCDCISEKYEAEVTSLGSANTKLQNGIKELEIELCQRECLIEKLQSDAKEMEIEICRRQCTINHLEQCLDKSNKILAECEKEMKEMHYENENLKKENESLRNNVQDYAFEAQRASTEKSILEEKCTAVTRQSQALELEKYQLSKNLQDKSSVEDELNHLKKQYNNLVKMTQEKDEELQNARKQIESLEYTLEANTKEHDKIMKAYKEVKETLSEEIRKYKKETERMNNERDNLNIDYNHEPKCTACLNVKELSSIIMEKDRKIKVLACRNGELEKEIAQLKTYVNKVISDNKNLRIAIDNLLGTLAQKLKNFTENEESASLKSSEILVKDILNSLMDMEQNVMVVNNGGTSTEKCNCMSVIMSTYKVDAKDSKIRHIPPCKLKCGKRMKDVSKYAGTISNSHEVINACTDCCDELI